MPPVPGAPVYLFGGLICVDGFMREFSNKEVGFLFGLAYVFLLCFILKLTACAIQQKVFGERLGNNEGIRTAVGVHTPFIRSIEVILKQPGLTFGIL